MQNKSRVRHHKTCAEKADILAVCEGSGITQRALAAQHGIALSTLQRWMRKSQTSQERGKGRLIEVPNLFGAGTAACTYRLRFPRGLVLEVESGFRPDELQSVVQLIQDL